MTLECYGMSSLKFDSSQYLRFLLAIADASGQLAATGSMPEYRNRRHIQAKAGYHTLSLSLLMLTLGCYVENPWISLRHALALLVQSRTQNRRRICWSCATSDGIDV